MFGVRGKIGLVIPSNNTVIEPELWAMRPEGVTIHASRVLSFGNTPEGIEQMERSAVRAVEELQAGDIPAIVYACLATSLIKGRDWTDSFASRLAAASFEKLTTAAEATLSALEALGAKRIAFATAYPRRINDHVAPFFTDYGFGIVSLRSLEHEDSRTLWRMPQERVADLVRAAVVPGVDAVCILGTDLPSAQIIEPLETELGLPVVTTNQAILRSGLALCGIEPSIAGFGRLLQQA